MARDHDDRSAVVALPQQSQKIDAVAVGKPNVKKVCVGAPGSEMSPEIRSRMADLNRIAFAFENQPKREANVGFVIDNENTFMRHCCVWNSYWSSGLPVTLL